MPASEAWQDAGLPPLPVAVNVSAVEFRDKNFVENVSDRLSGNWPGSRDISNSSSPKASSCSTPNPRPPCSRQLKAMGVQLGRG